MSQTTNGTPFQIRVHIGYLCTGPPGDVSGPEVEVRPVLPALEEEALVAVLHLGQLVHSEVRLAAAARKLETVEGKSIN